MYGGLYRKMLNLYRRHGTFCKNATKGQNYTNCNCPIWCYGVIDGREVRKSVGLRDWGRAVRRVERWEEKPNESEVAASLGVPNCIAIYLADCTARKLAPSTLVSYKKTLSHFERFCAGRGINSVHGLDLDAMTGFREWRSVAASTQAKEIENLRSFCRFCVKRKWIAENYAADVKLPKEDAAPTLPFERKEVTAIIGACAKLSTDDPARQAYVRDRAKALVYLLLYSGLRISDAMRLERSRLDFKTGRLLIRTMKTRVPLYVRLHADAVTALKRLPDDGSGYFFWTGKSKLATVIGNARRTFERVCAIAGVEGYPHRMRDTFAVELLKRGEDIRTVQLLLGHTSLRTTEKHYAPFVAAFQQRLDRATQKLNFG